jgi:acyl-CoA thioester hydrolase
LDHALKAYERLVTDFPVVVEIPVAWGEMDSMGHVNNIVYFRYFETARIAYFERVLFLEEMRESGVGPILAATQCRFKTPLTYPDRVWVGTRADDLEEDRFLMRYSVVSRAQERVAAEGDGRIVSYDYRASRKAPLPGRVRAAIESLQNEATS